MGNKRKLRSKESDETGPVSEKQSRNEKPDPGQEEEDIREPSKQEIEESLKPENVINVVTVRDKKRKVHKNIQEKIKETGDTRELISVKEYLNKWKGDRDLWKFEKRKQIYIQTNCFEPNRVQDDDWTVCLEYLEGSKGKSREALIASAEKLIGEIDESQDQQQDVAKNIKYNRARDLLQMLS